MTDRQTTIFLSAGETSGDMHGARLIEELRAQIAGVRCVGLGGGAMEQAGCELQENLVDRSAMLAHAIGQVPFYFKLLRQIKRYFKEHRPDVVVTIDSFEWNCHVAKAAHKLGIPVLTYIGPQLWAWGSWRAGKVRKYIDKIACILPFEEQWYRQRGIDATFVGHPLFDHEVSQVDGAPWLCEDKIFPTIALLPGSRKQEIARLWKPMQVIAGTIKRRFPEARFLTATPDDKTTTLLRESSDPHLGIEIRRTSVEIVTKRSDLALVASGTATLQTAGTNCPMLVMYYIHPAAWHLAGRWLLQTKYLSLVNILADRELVPEYMPFYRDTDGVGEKALELLEDKGKLATMREELKELVRPLVQRGAAARAADMIKALVEKANA